jgi:gentisate 1,2-dioxygenase
MGTERRVRGAAVEALSDNASEQSVLFSISDRPAQEALRIWREGK